MRNFLFLAIVNFSLLLFFSVVSAFSVADVFAADLPLEKIKLPSGFSIQVYAKNVENARSMTWGKDGMLFVGSMNAGNVYAVEPNGKVHIVARHLNMPNGVAYRDGNLYVAEVHRVIVFKDIDSRFTKRPSYEVIAKYPKDNHHGWKFMAFGPDSKLYVAQGAPCNICEVKDPYGTITRIDADGKNLAIVARGIRNSVGFDWQPGTKDLWFTDNGRDLMGDDVPPDELNHVTQVGQNFGFPYCHAGSVLDPQFGKGKNCKDYVSPVQNLGPHVAALGMRFYLGKMFPQKYQQQIFIAEHGSWNRSDPLGYRVSVVTLDEKAVSKGYEVFAEGWLQGKQAWGRPVDVLNGADGSLLVSDDMANAIYKISYKK